MNANYDIHHGDCLEVLASRPIMADLVFCSPPYEAARTYGIDFDLKGQDWVDWAVERFMACLKVCRGLVAWVVEGQTRKFRWSATPALFMADLHRRGVHLRKPPIYRRYSIPGSGGPDFLRNDYEFIVCAASGRLPWSDNKAMGHVPKWAPGGEMSYRQSDGARVNDPWGKRGRGNHVGGWNRQNQRNVGTHMRAPNGSRAGDLAENRRSPFPKIANPGNIIDCIVGGGTMGSRLCHENEAPFPERLAEFFIRSFCPPGGLVLDPFCGSGTTLAVALRHGRRAIGIDIRASQVELTRRRVAEVLNETPLLCQEASDDQNHTAA